jgi:hypothetical protein
MRSSSLKLLELVRRGGGTEANLLADVQTLLLYGGLNAEALVRRAVEAVETLDAEGLEARRRRSG